MNKCLNCSISISSARNRKFCGSSCSATYNNKLFPKRSAVPKKCIVCAGDYYSKGKYCHVCTPKSVLNRPKSDVSRSVIASNARIQIRDRNQECAICGYKNHTEACHIKPVRDFLDTELVKVINHPDNLVLLCPNHHWELDNGLLALFPE